MNGFISFIVDLLVFLLSLSVLVIIHEAGHLSAAKIFKVYCYEFSVGMGPAIYKKKPNKDKGQETVFSVRALPIGGYVSMAGEDLEEAEGVDTSIEVPKDRTLEAKPRWQRIIIMFAGVFLNFILGFVLFLISYSACPQYSQDLSSNKIQIVPDSLLAQAGVQDGDQIISIGIDYYNREYAGGELPTSPSGSIPVTEITCYAFTEMPEKVTDLNSSINVILSNIYYTDPVDMEKKVTYIPAFEGDKRVITITYSREGEVQEPVVIESVANADLVYQSIGVQSQIIETRYSFGEAWGVAWNQWCYACSAIFVGVGMLFTPQGWAGAGGIISIFKLSSQAASIGMGTFLNMWGLISVNLAIMNLLPFPGLDGWQIIVTICEGCYYFCRDTYRKIKYRTVHLTPEETERLKKLDMERSAKREVVYKKVKNIMSLVGLVLLIGLSVVLIIKDIVAPVI